MAMEGLRSRSSTIVTALLFLLTLVVLAAAAAAAAVEAAEQCHDDAAPVVADEPYALMTFQNKHGEEIRLLADQRSEPAAYSFADRSGNWFYGTRDRDDDGNGKPRRRRPLPHLSSRGGSRPEGLWNTLGALADTTTGGASSDDPPAAEDDEERRHYVLVGLQTSGGDKIRLAAVVADQQRYVYLTGFAKGFFYSPGWFFLEGERRRLVATLGDDDRYAHGGSHAEVVAANLLTALMKEGRSFF